MVRISVYHQVLKTPYTYFGKASDIKYRKTAVNTIAVDNQLLRSLRSFLHIFFLILVLDHVTMEYYQKQFIGLSDALERKGPFLTPSMRIDSDLCRGLMLGK